MTLVSSLVSLESSLYNAFIFLTFDFLSSVVELAREVPGIGATQLEKCFRGVADNSAICKAAAKSRYYGANGKIAAKLKVTDVTRIVHKLVLMVSQHHSSIKA